MIKSGPRAEEKWLTRQRTKGAQAVFSLAAIIAAAAFPALLMPAGSPLAALRQHSKR